MPFQFESKATARATQLKKAVLACFYSTSVEAEARFAGFELRDWQRILYWLDISGLALYLLDRLTELGVERCAPTPILSRFRGDLAENRARTDALFQEAAAISAELIRLGVEFALYKGVTLTPDSVPDSALRLQVDLDFLVAASDATAARHGLMTFGYGLHAVCGNSMEFAAGEKGAPDIRKIYRIRTERCLEMHMVATAGRDGLRGDRLSRAELRTIRGVMIPALAPADTLVQQCVHLFKHICGEHTRASWALELWRHLQARTDDAAFWQEVEKIAATEPQGEISLGVALLLSKMMFGAAGQNAFTRSAIERLPHKVRLWVETYGQRVLFADTAGNKLYLILRRELRSETQNRPALRRLIFPTHLPPPITRGEPGERLGSRLSRYRRETSFFFWRLRFHVVEGLRYAIELSRWQRRMTETSR